MNIHKLEQVYEFPLVVKYQPIMKESDFPFVHEEYSRDNDEDQVYIPPPDVS
jgi:hypothetical protein